MKKLIVLSALLLTSFIVPAQTLTVIHEDFAAAKAAAAKEHKLLLIDFYTTWCGPCKRLSKAVFDNDKHAATIAKNFVLLKYDAEKDTSYHLSKKFHISSYPTGLVMNNDGRVVQKKFGMKTNKDGVDIDDYLSFLDDAVKRQKENKYIKGISKEINLQFPEFYINYINRTKKIEKEDLENYWSGTTDYLSEVQFCILAYFGGSPEANTYFLAHKDVYKDMYGEKDVTSLTYRIVSRTYKAALKEKDKKKLEEANKLAKTHLPTSDVKNIREYYNYKFWEATGDWQKVIDYADANKKDFIASGQMNAICWSIFENCKDKAVIKKATTLMGEYNKTNSSFAALDTYANLLYKSGDSQNAIKQMEKAILMGRAEKADTKESEEALAKFKGAQ